MNTNIEKISKKITKVSITVQDGVCNEKIDFLYNDEVPVSQKSITCKTIPTFKTRVAKDAALKSKLTANGTVTYYDDIEYYQNDELFTVRLSFELYKKQILTGLGQFEDGQFDYSGKTEYLYQSNMRSPVPILISSEKFAIIIDSESDIIFSEKDNIVTFEIGACKTLSYYVIVDESLDDIIAHIRSITGKASFLPRWTFGYLQSKERYDNAQELLDTAQKFRENSIPIDCLIEDWYTWEEGKWGNKIADKKRFPNLSDTISKLHANNIKLLWSVWPNMSETSEDYLEFRDKNLLLGTSQVYDAYSQEGVDLYSEQSNRELLSAGLDGFWCDSSEPFSDPDWKGSEKVSEKERYERVVTEARKHIDWEKTSAYPMYHAKGFYENFLNVTKNKRVVNLTRSVYTGSQSYGTILWSGDISAKWETMKNQIAEGLKFSMTGHPYWTLDIGAFFVVDDKYENRGCKSTSTEKLWFWNGDYNDGVLDAGYVELYTRWLQFGAFLPIFRSHGTDTPREPWNFKHKDFNCYQIIVDYIKLRYKLMPYIYSLVYKAHENNYTLMRSFLFDFANDKKAASINNSYMFGDAFLVQPITKAMYYNKNNEKINTEDFEQEVYLPKNSVWYDYFTNKAYEGGQTIVDNFPIEKMPIFVKAGSIIPVTNKELQNVENDYQDFDEIFLYEGANGSFSYYNDTGDGFQYQNGEFTQITFEYDTEKNTFKMSKNYGNIAFSRTITLTHIQKDGTSVTSTIVYENKEICIQL